MMGGLRRQQTTLVFQKAGPRCFRGMASVGNLPALDGDTGAGASSVERGPERGARVGILWSKTFDRYERRNKWAPVWKHNRHLGNRWFAATVLEHNAAMGQHCIAYDDGEVRWHHMSERVWRPERVGPSDSATMRFSLSWTDAMGRRQPSAPLRFSVVIDGFASSRVIYCGLSTGAGAASDASSLHDLYSVTTGLLPALLPSRRQAPTALERYERDMWVHGLMLGLVRHLGREALRNAATRLVSADDAMAALGQLCALCQVPGRAAGAGAAAGWHTAVALLLFGFIGQAAEMLPSDAEAAAAEAEAEEGLHLLL